jgi:uncharacterized protein (TIGR03067 family)
MRTTLALALLLIGSWPLFSVPAPKDAPNPAADELKAIQGDWRLIGWLSIDGERDILASLTPAERQSISMRITGARMEFRINKNVDRMDITLDPLQHPKAIDLERPSGVDFKGIYELKNDRLVICLASHDRPRPSEFGDKEDRFGSIYTYERPAESAEPAVAPGRNEHQAR